MSYSIMPLYNNTCLIIYQLQRPGQDYPELITEIKKLGNHWHVMKSKWIINTSLKAVQIRDRLLPYLDKNDQMLVVKTNNEAAWTGLSVEGGEWLKRNLNV